MTRGRAPAAAFHPRNRHQGRYAFARLARAHPGLAAFLARTPAGEAAVDFADPRAVLALNAALLADWYGIARWRVPEGYLCPAVPGRADLVHHAADLLAGEGRRAPRGPRVRVLDVGTGAGGVYPLVGHAEYGWSFVASEVDPGALDALGRVLAANPRFGQAVELRRQHAPLRVFAGVVRAGEEFDLVLCNPPFHAGPGEAKEASRRKWRNLGRQAGRAAPALNFGGRPGELWCRGGEAGFVGRMIDESRDLAGRVAWFTALVADKAHLARLEERARGAGAAAVRAVDMAQGQKRSRLLAWSFLDAEGLRAWRARRWEGGGAASRPPARPAARPTARPRP